MCPSSRLDCDSQFTILSPLFFDRSQLWRSMSVYSSLHLLTRAHCAQCSPSIPVWLPLQILAPAGGRKQSPDCALRIPVSHDRRRVCFSFLLVHQAFWSWCRSRIQQPIRDFIPSKNNFFERHIFDICIIIVASWWQVWWTSEIPK